MKRLLVSVPLLAIFLISSALGEWKEPEGKTVSEAQYILYADTMNDWLSETAKIMAAMRDAKSDADRLAAVSGMSDREQACYDRHHTSRPEIEWIGKQLVESWGVIVAQDQIYSKTQADLSAKIKADDDKITEAQARLLAFQKALKADNPGMTDEQKTTAKSDSEAGVAQAQADIDQATAEKAQWAESQSMIVSLMQEQTKRVPPENLALLRQHQKDYDALFNRIVGATNPTTDPTTMPTTQP